MKQLWVLRHAKAGPHVANDHDRKLVTRGVNQCASIAEQLTSWPGLGAFPPLILTSSASRARNTAQEIVERLGAHSRLEVERLLYQADADDIVSRLHELDDEVRSVMVVGHNPALSDLARLLIDPGDAEGRAQADDGLPTAGLVVITFDIKGWSELGAGSGRLVAVYKPS